MVNTREKLESGPRKTHYLEIKQFEQQWISHRKPWRWEGNTISDPERNELPTPNPILGENLSQEWKGAKISQMKENQERLSPADWPWKNGSSKLFKQKKRKQLWRDFRVPRRKRVQWTEMRASTTDFPSPSGSYKLHLMLAAKLQRSLMWLSKYEEKLFEAILCVINRGDKGL